VSGTTDTITSNASFGSIPTAATAAGTVSITPDVAGTYTVTVTLTPTLELLQSPQLQLVQLHT
jgi:hypothetical protein